MKRLLVFMLICVGMAALSHAAAFDPNIKSTFYEDWSYGLNTQADPGKLQTTMSPAMSNLLIDEISGAIVTRNGYAVVVNTPTLSKITFMYQFQKDSGDNEFVVSDSSRVLTTRDFRTFVVVKTTLTPTAVLRAAQVRGKIWFTNGVDPVFTWDGNVHQVLDGSNGTPNVPRGKYISFYQERVWVFSTVSANYALAFSALASSATSAAIAPDDFRAWLANNQLNIGQGDAYAGSGIDVYKGQLVLHKSNGASGAIYTLFGNDEFTYFARKTNAEVGTNSNDSIVQLDNFEYFMAKDGVYAFDGADTKRISDAIKPEMEDVVSNLTRIVSQTWDTKTDFDRGGIFSKTTSTAGGFVSIFATTYTLTTTDEATKPSGTPILLPISSESNFATVVTTAQVPATFTGRITRLGLWLVADSNPSHAYIYIQNTRTGDVCYVDFNVPPASADHFYLYQGFPLGGTDVGFSTVQFTGSDVAAGNMQIKIKNANGTGGFSFYPATTTPNSSIWLSSFTDPTGSYISEVSTASIITFWDQFIVSDFPNSGVITYYIRGATSPVNISTEAWASIVSGSNVGLPIAKNYIQWAATLSVSGANSTPQIDFVTIRHNEGSSDDNRPFAVPWKARYILSVATESNTVRSVQFVKTKISNTNPIAWTRWDGIHIRSMAIYNSNLYAGGASTGTIYRLDYGLNDAGSAISWAYDTPSMTMGERFFLKMLQSLVLEVDLNGGGSMSLSRSVNGGNYSASTIGLGGAGKLFYEDLSAIEKGKYFRFRFSGSTMDMPVTIRSFGVFYKELNTR